MKKLLKMFKSLPREVKMMLAMAGLASPIGAIYFLRRFFPGVSTFTLILCVAGVILGICLIAFLISLVFKRGGKKRSKKMAQELASESAGGPAGMDVSASIKANNEKFFTAVRDLRKEVGISVYDLPWYIVMGDSGCGKTYLVNNGGLTFSRGKPEGYQLGTLNYNWWFTEDAVFVDMAGRLCNPQDDADRREWDAFLNTIAKGRKGFPINGAIVCVSAEHLLQDPPEKHEVDANIALERLRDLQTKLGVTFATYLVITKCDKILGFMQFFDRADRDITVKNQMFGWSRPGDFHELSDPERFKEDFSGVYHRLNGLRLRRLNDEADEIDLGLACSFPEEFRELLDPLHTYVRTLFPMIKSPRAVKNLLFRGVYLTSATQEGGLILKHLKERLGDEAGDQFAPLDSLFPNKRPHFIKDVLFKKVFPEQGLVFRNEQQVLRNRKWSRVLTVATAVLAITLFAAFVFSWRKFDGLIVEPRRHAQKVVNEAATMAPDDALRHATVIEADVENLRANAFSAQVLSVFIGHEKPIDHLKVVRVSLIERAMMAALRDVDQALRSGRAVQLGDRERATAYLEALRQYVLWNGCAGEPEAPSELGSGSFEALCKLAESGSIAARPDFVAQTQWYFNTLRAGGSFAGRNPARLLPRAVSEPADTVLAALGHAYGHLARYATMNAEHPDETIREWMRLRDQCEQIQDSYRKMLAAADEAAGIGTQEELQDFQKQFVAQFQRFDEALGAAAWGGKGAGTTLHNIRSLKQAIKQQQDFWHAYVGGLEEAAGACATVDPRIKSSIESLIAGSSEFRRDGFDRALWNSLEEMRIVDRPYGPDVYDERIFDKAIVEVYQIYPDVLAFTKGDGFGALDELALTPAAGRVRGLLAQISARLAEAELQVPEDLAGETLAGWSEALDVHLEAMDAEQEPIALDDVPAAWEPEALGTLYEEYQNLIRLGEGTRLLKTIVARLDKVGPWGIAELVPYEERATEKSSPFTIAAPERSLEREERRAESRKIERKEPEQSRRSKRRPRGTRRGGEERGQRPEPTRESGVRTGRAAGRVPAVATYDFMNDRASEVATLLPLLVESGEMDAFLRKRDEPDPLNLRCVQKLENATKAYMERYVRSWSAAYGAKKLTTLERLNSRVSNWNQLATRLASQSAGGGSSRYDIANEFEDALVWLLRAVPWVIYHPDGFFWASDDFWEWTDLAGWMEASMTEGWDAAKLGDFVFARKTIPHETEPGRYPWDTIAGQFRETWMELSRRIGENAELPDRFPEADAWTSTPILWGGLAQLRDTYGLDDEDNLSGALVRFEERAREHLSVELTRILCDIQQAYFQRDKPFDGWPYFEGERYTATGLDTVDFQKFKEFLVEVHRAKAGFEDLENHLPNDAVGRRERKAFYTDCEDWYKFLRLEDDLKTDAEVLNIVITGRDATDEPFGQEQVDDTAQQKAAYFVLDIDLTLSKEDRAGGEDVLRIATETQYKTREREVTWEWPSTGKELYVSLEERLQDIEDPKRILGRSSPLALCAYLHQYGISHGDRKTWYASHAFKTSETMRRPDEPGGAGRGKRVGEKAVFTLRRALPEPIARLVEVKGSERSRR